MTPLLLLPCCSRRTDVDAPTCVRQQQQRPLDEEAEEGATNGKSSGFGENMSVFHLDLDSTSQVNHLWTRFFCNVQANPPPTSFIWSFVPLEKVSKLIATEQQSFSMNNLKAVGSHDEAQDEEERRISLNRKLQDFANFQTETKSNEINYIDLVNISSNFRDVRPLGGILICYAQNQVGKQLKPCLNLLLPPG